MEDSFEHLWKLVSGHGSVALLHKDELERLWRTYTLEQQRTIYAAIERKLKTGGFVHYNPVLAVKDNAPRAPVMKIISSDTYYQIYGTTEEKDGWTRKFLPEQHKTIYYKQS